MRQSTKDCTTCHMPKYEVPGTHTQFTDHWIHVVRSDMRHADYPNSHYDETILGKL